MVDTKTDSLETTVTNLAQWTPSEAWLRSYILEKVLKGNETWDPKQILELANEYYNWVKTGRTDIVH